MVELNQSLRMVNIYLPRGKTPSDEFYALLRSHSGDAEFNAVYTTDDGETVAICEVGFSWTPLTKISLHHKLLTDLGMAPDHPKNPL